MKVKLEHACKAVTFADNIIFEKFETKNESQQLHGPSAIFMRPWAFQMILSRFPFERTNECFFKVPTIIVAHNDHVTDLAMFEIDVEVGDNMECSLLVAPSKQEVSSEVCIKMGRYRQ